MTDKERARDFLAAQAIRYGYYGPAGGYSEESEIGRIAAEFAAVREPLEQRIATLESALRNAADGLGIARVGFARTGDHYLSLSNGEADALYEEMAGRCDAAHAALSGAGDADHDERVRNDTLMGVCKAVGAPVLMDADGIGAFVRGELSGCEARVRAEERERIKQWMEDHGAEMPGWGFMQDMVDESAIRARGDK